MSQWFAESELEPAPCPECGSDNVMDAPASCKDCAGLRQYLEDTYGTEPQRWQALPKQAGLYCAACAQEEHCGHCNCCEPA